MIEWYMWLVLGLASLAGLAGVVLGLVGQKPNDYTVGALVVIELLLVAQGVIALVAPHVGNPPTGDPLEFGVYAVSILLVPPAAVIWALVDRTRWSTVVLGAGGFTVAVMIYRMWQIWTIQGS